jgi:hypothetical protein
MVNPATQTLKVFDSFTFCPYTHPSPQTCHHSASSFLDVRISCHVIAVFVFRKPIFTVIMAPKRKSIDAASASKPKRSRDVFSINQKVKILGMNEIVNESYAEIARLYCKNGSSIRELKKSREKYMLVFC